MSLLNKLTFLKDPSGKSYLNWFSIWFLLYPFDAYVLPVSIGFMTIYPHLILTFLLLVWSFFIDKKASLPFHLKSAIGYYILLASIGLVSIFFVAGKNDAIYAARSLIMLAATVSLILLSYAVLGREAFFDRVFQLSTIVFIFFCAAAWFEFYTGIHFESPHTNKLLLLPASNVTYAPTFLYQNPNTFLCYIFSSALIMILCSKKLQNSLLMLLPIIAHLMIFSIAADSQLGKLASAVMFVFFGLMSIRKGFIANYKLHVIALLSMVILLLIVASENPIFYGPIWKKGKDYLLNSILVIKETENKNEIEFQSSSELVEKYGKEKIIDLYYEYQSHGKAPSSQVRKNLFLNGIYLIKKHPIVGVGAGQYSWLSAHGELPYDTGTVISPHESVVEFTSQYGIPMLLLNFVLMGMTFLFILKSQKNKFRFAFFWAFIVAISWVVAAMPSAWLVLNCGWILMALILVSPQLHTENRVD